MSTPRPAKSLAPSPAALARVTAHFTPGVVQELHAIEKEMGGRQALIGMLVLAPLTPDLRYALGMLGDPSHAGKSLAHICAAGNILPGKLLEHLSAAALLRGKVRASQKIGEGIAAVAEDVMRRAAPYTDACHACQGTGSVTPEPSKSDPNPSPGPCDTCQGVGKLLYQPDLARQQLAIEMAQLLPKGGGINIQQNTLVGGAGGAGGGGGALEQLQLMTDRILYGPPVGEGEVVEGAVEGEIEGMDAGANAGADAP